jgi:hypothetical protein
VPVFLSKQQIYTVFIVQAYQTSQYVVPCGGIFLGKGRSSFAGSSDGKMNVQSACALNTRYNVCSLVLDKFFRSFQNYFQFFKAIKLAVP